MKGYDEAGIIFGTSYASTKGAQLAVNPRAALVFPWHAMQRQVRVAGRVERIGDDRVRRALGPAAARRAAGRGGVGAVDGRRLARGTGRADAAARRADRRRRGARGRTSGAATGSCPTGWSSGRAAPTGCTTGCGSCATRARAAAGSCSGSLHDEGPAAPDTSQARRGPLQRGRRGRSTPPRLRNPPFRRLFWGVAATMLGQQMTLVAVPFQVYALTGSSLLVGVTSIVALVPLIVFGLLGGAIADAMDRRRLMLITSWGAAVTSGLLAVQALLPGGGNLVLLWVLTAAVSGFAAVNQPTRSAAIPALVGPAGVPGRQRADDDRAAHLRHRRPAAGRAADQPRRPVRHLRRRRGGLRRRRGAAARSAVAAAGRPGRHRCGS